MKMLTFVDIVEIDAMEKSMSEEGYRPNTVQRRLAEEVTRFVHGEEGLLKALKATEGLKPGSDTVLDAETLDMLADVVPLSKLTRDEVVGKPVADVMATSGLQKSKGEAKRMIKGGGAKLNNKKVTEEDQVITESDLIGNRMLMLNAGKKNKMLIRIV